MISRFAIYSLSVAIIVALISGCSSRKHKEAEVSLHQPLDSIEIKYAPSIEIGTKVPDFSARDTSGVEIKLSDYKGSYIVLDFWATWCGDCREEMPILKDVFSEYKNTPIAGKSVVFISYSFDNETEAWKKYISENNLDWIQVSTLVKWHDNPVSEAYKVKWIPSFYVIDPEGAVVGSAVKAFRIREILQSIR